MVQINKKLIQNFIKSANWEAVWNNGNFSEDNTSAIEESLDKEQFYYDCGVTKMVIIPIDASEKYVIKIPFMYLYVENDDIDDDNDRYCELQCAPRPKGGIIDKVFYQTDWDYCETEVEYCDLAAAANISEFFPETIKYCDTPYPIYLQEKCKVSYLKSKDAPVNLNRESLSNEIKSRSSAEVAKWCYTFSISWLQDVIKWYGIEKLIALFAFMNHYNMIDFHSSNYGYRESDGSPVLIDFAGFYET